MDRYTGQLAVSDARGRWGRPLTQEWTRAASLDMGSCCVCAECVDRVEPKGLTTGPETVVRLLSVLAFARLLVDVQWRRCQSSRDASSSVPFGIGRTGSNETDLFRDSFERADVDFEVLNASRTNENGQRRLCLDSEVTAQGWPPSSRAPTSSAVLRLTGHTVQTWYTSVRVAVEPDFGRPASMSAHLDELVPRGQNSSALSALAGEPQIETARRKDARLERGCCFCRVVDLDRQRWHPAAEVWGDQVE